VIAVLAIQERSFVKISKKLKWSAAGAVCAGLLVGVGATAHANEANTASVTLTDSTAKFQHAVTILVEDRFYRCVVVGAGKSATVPDVPTNLGSLTVQELRDDKCLGETPASKDEVLKDVKFTITGDTTIDLAKS
jgi:hypothetical protein